ncbi:hypothetical protein I3842_07G163600 [Carya illinoinensis]|uniref:Fucosyltransferase n=1 Tax=Carya illinoinensis TaxID=32201 RepID=A0A922JGT1_CARIL|nr:hypothetical protein I3842_07G163600 [Carya illinoinensis]
MLGFTFFLFFPGILEFPSISNSIQLITQTVSSETRPGPDPFTDSISVFRKWDSQVGCVRFREKHKALLPIHSNGSSALHDYELNVARCIVVRDRYSPALFGDPLRVYMDLEAGSKRSGVEDIFISYHANDDVQSTYAGGPFRNSRNYQDTLVYWSSSRCLPQRNQLAKQLLSLLPHHSFGNASPKWWDHLHCAMSHYKFVLAIENIRTESYVTEKLFYALGSGAVPIYFSAPNVWDFVPPHSIIDGSKFSSLEGLASHVKTLANDPVAYSEYHAWRRCGVLGSYGKTRALSLDTLPCRLCETVSRRVGRNVTG